MKKIILLCLLSLTLISPSQASAKVILQERGTVTIPASEIIDDDLFVAAESVVIGGKITGDVFVGTGNLILSGATIEGSLIAGATNITIDKASKISGSLIAGTGNFKNSAPIGRNLMVGAGTIYQDNKVGKEARLGGGSITFGPSTNITGNLTYALGEDNDEISQDLSATIAGTVSRYTPPESARRDMAKAKEDMAKLGRVAHGGWLTISFLGSLLVGFLVIKLFPKTSLGLSATVSKSLMPSLGSGFLIVVAALPIFLVLALTVIGLPVLGLLIPLFFVDLHLAKLVSSFALGRFVVKQFSWNKMGVYAIFSVGLILFYFLRAIPGIGGITSILFTWTGLGAIWHYTRSNLKSL